MKSRTTLFSFLTIGLIAACFWMSAQAQQNKEPQTPGIADSQVLGQILAEVRDLRGIVQHSTQSIYRGQLLLEQLRIQQEIVSKLTGQIEEARLQLAGLRNQQPQLQERLSNLENEYNSESNPQRKAQLEIELKAFRQFAETQAEEEHRKAERDGVLVRQLVTEQGVLQDLTEQVKSVESTLVETAATSRNQVATKKNQR